MATSDAYVGTGIVAKDAGWCGGVDSGFGGCDGGGGGGKGCRRRGGVDHGDGVGCVGGGY